MERSGVSSSARCFFKGLPIVGSPLKACESKFTVELGAAAFVDVESVGVESPALGPALGDLRELDAPKPSGPVECCRLSYSVAVSGIMAR